MTNHNLRRRLLASTVFGVAVAVAAPVAVQAQEADQPTSVSDIVVTGSRIARRDAVAESPILTVQQEDITHSGATTVEHYLNTLPQITAGLSSQSNNPSSNGRAFIDLRGLGAGRNLVLLDGRRPMGSTAAGTVDTNTIPAALIDRVEIISGGAASTYGADAVSGVVNFILKDQFEGIQIDSQYRLTEQSDGQEWSTDITFGGNFADGKGNAVFNASYFNREVMYKDAREFSAQASSTTSIFPGGSAGIGANAPTQAQMDTIFGGSNRCHSSGGWAGFGFNPDGRLFCTGIETSTAYNIYGYTGPESAIATAFAPNIFSYNFEPDNILVLPMERWNLFTRVNYEVNEQFKPYVQAMYTNYNAKQELAPTPAGGTTGWDVAVDNPFISPQLAQVLAARPDPTQPFAFSKRFNDLGGRTGFSTHDVWQIVLGTKGRLARTETWNYDIYASYGRSVMNELQGGNVRRDRVGQLIGAIEPRNAATETVAQYNARVAAFRAPTVAQQAAISGGACPNGLNLFGAAAIDPSCAAWISLEAKNLTVAEQSVVEGVVNGDLFELPAGPVQAAFGMSYRELNFDFRPDSGLQPGLVAGFNQQLPISGFLNWTDIFGELLVPIVKDVAFAKDMSLSLGYRVSDNSHSGSSESWKANLEWEVNDWFRIRGGVQTAIRSPSISELYAPRANNFPSFNRVDPCDTRLPATASYSRAGPNGAKVTELCLKQSAVAGSNTFTWSGQIPAIGGGNPELVPEEAESYTLGFVARSPFNTGSWADSLYLSVDYWSIEVEKSIAALGVGTIVQRCFNLDNANPTYDENNEWCQLFERNQSNGSVQNVVQLSRNQSVNATSGVDFNAAVRFELGDAGSLALNWLGTWVEKFENQVSPLDPVRDYVGTIGSGTGSAAPEWRHTFSATWALDPFSVTATARYIDDMVHSNTVTGGAGTGVPDMWYADLRATWNLNDTVAMRVGVNNVFDEAPPLYSPNVQANTDPSTYDILGRRYFVGLTARF